MRFPIRDVVPSRTRPLVTWTCLALSAAWLLVDDPSLLTVGAVLVHALPLLVLGETVEDQLGHGRHLGLLGGAVAVGTALGAGLSGVLPAMTAAIVGAHLAMFPTARILVAYWFDVIEIPSFFLAGCWVLLIVMIGVLGAPVAAPAAALVLAAACARVLRRRDRARWEHFDQTR